MSAMETFAAEVAGKAGFRVCKYRRTSGTDLKSIMLIRAIHCREGVLSCLMVIFHPFRGIKLVQWKSVVELLKRHLYILKLVQLSKSNTAQIIDNPRPRVTGVYRSTLSYQ